MECPFTIMAARNLNERRKFCPKSRGQSLIEFILFLPFIAMMIMYLVQITGAISASINYQQFARAKLFQILFNKKEYPASRFVYKNAGNRFYLGVNGEVIPEGTPFDNPESLLVKVGNEKGSEETGLWPDIRDRQNIRVKTVVGICTPNNINGESLINGDFIDEKYADSLGKIYCSK